MYLLIVFLVAFQWSCILLKGTPTRDIQCNVELNFIICYPQISDTQLTSLSIKDCNTNAFPNSDFRIISPISLEHFKSTIFPNVIMITFLNSGITSLDPELFQQQPKLRQILAQNEPFHCDCDMQWTSIVSDTFDWSITGTCATPSELNGKLITDSSNYVRCTQTQSFQCFNESFICPTNSTCYNTVDNAYCECNEGYFLFDNECHLDIDCALNNGDCEQLCSNTNGMDHCECTPGYRLYGDMKSCLDINECTEQLDNCQQICVNTNGSYDCSCHFGFNEYTGSCIDIDECLFNNGACDQICTNTNGSFYCSCELGYSFDSVMKSCVDVNECLTEAHTCHHFCVNTIGSFNCDCQQGHILTATGSCVDIDECLFNNGGCGHTCTNTNGSFHCSCMQGYALKDDGKTCQDIDECSDGTHNCQQICINKDGLYDCGCYTGFNLTTDAFTCSDVDECLVNNGGCEKTCYNTIGSFNCSCPQGYTLNIDKRSCVVVVDACLGNTNGTYECQSPQNTERTTLISIFLLLFVLTAIILTVVIIICCVKFRLKKTDYNIHNNEIQAEVPSFKQLPLLVLKQKFSRKK